MNQNEIPPLMERRLEEIISLFKTKGATSPEKALTPEELGLPSVVKYFIRSPMGSLSPFVEVDGKFYLSEEKLPQMHEMLSTGPPLVPPWVKHTARVPRGYLRYQVLMFLKEQAMSGSEIASRIEQDASGRWRPSPGSLYPLLRDLEGRGFAEELPLVDGTKRYRLTELGHAFLQEETQVASQMREKLESGMFLFPPFFNLPEGLHFLIETAQRMFEALFALAGELSESPDPGRTAELEKLMRSTADRLERLVQRHEK